MTRKYGQRGYMQGDRQAPAGRSGRPEAGGGAPARRDPPPPRHNLDRPGGRGLGAPDEQVFRCAVCGALQEAPRAEGLESACAHCGADLHSCTHCASFDTASPWECRRWQERRAASLGPVTKKSKRNDCTLFAPKASVEFAKEKPADSEPDDPRAAFEALFKR